MKECSITLEIDGKIITLSSGKMAKQANGSVLAECEGSAVLATATMGKNAVEDPGFFPLSVHYTEKFYADGRIPGGFFKRESKPSDKAVLTSRIIDRSLRPLFQEGFKNEVQVVPTVLATGKTFPSEVLALLASSAALYISDIPFDTPIGISRIALLNGNLTVNPSIQDFTDSTLDLTVAGNSTGVTMIEGTANIITDEQMIKAIDLGFETIQKQIEAQKELRKLCGKPKKEVPLFLSENSLIQEVTDFSTDKIIATFSIREKLERYAVMDAILSEAVAHFSSQYEAKDIPAQVKKIIHDLEYELVRDNLFENNLRVDGRKPNELRNIFCEVGLFKPLHGSALFTRGETQSLGVLTLGAFGDSQKIDDLESSETSKNYFLHYNFPPYSVGEAGRMGAPGRREIGHGYLAEKSLKAVLPNPDNFPYTMRLVSEILESNGSSSMASVCSCSMALMDGGVPIKEHVAGIAMGLMYDKNKTNYKILTDIQGLEDHYGDIDFKVAGTKDGITAFQLDIKMDAVKINILKEALKEAYEARLKILDNMNKAISSPREDLSPFAPQLFSMKVNPDNIRFLIGPGGKTIKGLSEELGINIEIEKDSIVHVSAPSIEASNKARERISFMVRDINIGSIIEGRVVKITTFGAFIELALGREGLCHISQIADHRLNSVEEVLKVDQIVKVKVIETDKQGKIALTMKNL